MKTTKTILIFLLSLLFILPLCACKGDDPDTEDENPVETGESDFVYRVEDNGDAIITRYKSKTSAIIIPSSLDGHPVTTIGASAFFNNTSVKEIVIPSGVKVIEDSAFASCTSLKKVTIPSTVTTLGDKVFHSCSKLEEIVIEDGSALKKIGKNIFTYCSSLKFGEYGNAKYLPVGDNPYEILFSVIDSSLESMSIHGDTKIIMAEAFAKCSNLREITIPEKVEYIGDKAFYSCSNLVSIYYNARRVSDLLPGSAVFQLAAASPNALTMWVGKSVERIPAYLFDSAQRFRYLKFDTECICESIGEGAFSGTPLKELVIPQSIKVIEDYAFYNCTWLDTIKLDAVNLSDFADDNNIFTKAGINAEDTITVTFGDDATRVPANFLKTFDNIKIIVFNNNLVTSSFGKDAFLGCNRIDSVYIKNRKGWCEALFENKYANPLCYGNSKLYIDKSPDNNNDNNGDEKIEYVVNLFVMNDVNRIGDYVFTGYNKLQAIVIPKSVTSIGYGAFSEATALNYVYFEGTKSDWENLSRADGNDPLLKAEKIYFYSETEPTEPGNFWRYVDGIPKVYRNVTN